MIKNVFRMTAVNGTVTFSIHGSVINMFCGSETIKTATTGSSSKSAGNKEG